MYLLGVLDNSTPRIMSFQRAPTYRTVRYSSKLAGTRLVFTGCSDYICREGRRGGGIWFPIPNFVDLSSFTFVASVPCDAPLVFLSRVESIKGAHIAIEAAKRTGRRLLIAGNHAQNGSEHEYWKNRIEPELSHENIEYVGPVDDEAKNALLGSAAAMIVPIQWDEPFGIVFAEALACGTPVISCPRGALPEIIDDGIEGFLKSDLESMCDAVLRIAEIDRARCRKKAETHFSSQVVTSKYESLYAQLTGSEPHR
jgi:glycosyltransferase involved in cell wall biosynthesis